MLLQFRPQYRDDAESASARFPGDPVRPRPTGRSHTAGAVGLSATAVLAAFLYLLITAPGRLPGATPPSASPLWDAIVEADRINSPAFLIGMVVAAVGGAMVVVPVAYGLAVRRSERPVIYADVTVDLAEQGLTLRSPGKEMTVAWEGVVAFAETKSLFVLKALGDLRIALPKRGVYGFEDSPQAAAAELRDLLRRRVAPLAGFAPDAPTTPRMAA